MTCLSPAACLLLWVCVCCCVLPLALAQEEVPVDVHVWWEDKKHNHENLIARLKKYSASLPQRQHAMSDEDEQHGGAKPNPVIDAFDRTNTHAYVILGPHPVRAENVRNFSRALGFTESGGKHLSKINTVL
jgi:hypothetical protein